MSIGSPAGHRTGKTADAGAGAEGTRPLDVTLARSEQIDRLFQAYLFQRTFSFWRRQRWHALGTLIAGLALRDGLSAMLEGYQILGRRCTSWSMKDETRKSGRVAAWGDLVHRKRFPNRLRTRDSFLYESWEVHLEWLTARSGQINRKVYTNCQINNEVKGIFVSGCSIAKYK